ncbi:hypothetical protein BDY19DRAFT_15390 [Irpex rosettiformis]|uniref:Uncharacterized protein n=1 Tax=Irpex rosettiformis TaxID=378272 RepID=A0ACB8UIU5_9APHY|nr:hypothetical protein BDY19DRAFT_15390 [Irpex rosettiformis]
MSQLPPFLEPLDKQLPGQPSTQPVHYRNAVFRHKHVAALSHALWWPSQTDSKNFLIFVTGILLISCCDMYAADTDCSGNPGLLDFYTPFLTAIHDKAQGGISILGHALIGHTPGIEYPDAGTSATSLTAQVEGLVEIVDAVKSHSEKLTVVGHSMGSWLTMQALKARPEHVDSVILLFPTICHIADTPNGHKLSNIFRPPIPSIVSWSSVFTRILPSQALAMLFKEWPVEQLQVLRGLLNSPTSIYNALNLANDEMNTIKEPDVALLQQYRHRIHLYFGEADDWVGKQKDTIVKAFEADAENIKVVHGHPDIPHSFCINHGEAVAEQCYEWLQSSGCV